MFGPDAGQTGEPSFAIQPLATAKQNRSKSVDPACRLYGDLVDEGPHIRPG